MKKVYQENVNRKNGDCMQAVIASMFNLKLEEVPKFIEVPENKWFSSIYNFVKEHDHKYRGMLHNKNYTRLNHPAAECFKPEKWHMPHIMTKRSLYKYTGVDGYFFTSVLSPKYFKLQDQATHAVVIDKDFNIVHDPNPGYKNILVYPLTSLLKYNGIVNVFLFDKI